MTHQEIYIEALHFIEGSGGYPKDEKKGYKKMKEAADAGNTAAAGKYALYLWEKTKHFDALSYFEKNNAYKEMPRDYVTCIYNCAIRKKKDLALLKTYYEKASRVRSNLHGDSYYYFAMIAKMSGQDVSVYKEALYYAALGSSTAMPDRAYKEINRERGVVYGKDEVSLYVKVNYSGEDEKYFGGFLPCTQTEKSAWNVAKANLSDKRIKKEFGFAGAAALLKAEPKGVLEYQPVAYSCMTVGTVSCKFKYNNPSYSTVNTGSGSLPLNWNWFNYHAGFRTKYRQGDYHKQFENASFSKLTPDARMRTAAPRWSEIVDASFEMAKSSATSGARSKYKTAIASNYNWEERYVTVDIEDNGQSIKALKTYFVPFWFFTVNLPFGKTATARVNGNTGEVDFFANNPFGLFTPYDDVKAGAMTMYSKELQKVIRKRTPEYKKTKKHLIGLLIQVILFFLGVVAESGFIALLALLSIPVHLAAWWVPAETWEKLFAKIKSKMADAKAKAAEKKAAEKQAQAAEAKKTEAPKAAPAPVASTDDDDNDDDIITLLNKDGEETDFVEIAGIAYNGNFYAILQPVELLDGMDDDEALVFKVTKNADGEDNFEIELDDAIIDAVFAEYNKLLDAEMKKNG